MYRVFRRNDGVVDAINRLPDGATIPTWDAEHPLTIAYQAWKAEHPEFDDSNHDPEPPAPEPPNVGALRFGCLSDPGYNRLMAAIAATQPHLAGSFQVAVAVSPLSLYGLQVTWNAMIQALPSGQEPTPAEIAGWQAIADGANFNTELATITFNPDGTITCTGTLDNI